MDIDEKEKFIYASILNDMTDGVIVIGFDGKIGICNQAASAALNYNGGLLEGKSIVMLMSEFEENDEFFELILDAVYMKKKNMDDINYEYVNGSNILTIIKKLS